jgi:hypothetical protein
MNLAELATLNQGLSLAVRPIICDRISFVLLLMKMQSLSGDLHRRVKGTRNLRSGRDLAFSITVAVVVTSTEIGFSHITCKPRSRAWTIRGAWVAVAVQIKTA